MSLSERDISLIKAMAEEMNKILDDVKAAHQKDVEEHTKRISKLESEVEGLISLLGE